MPRLIITFWCIHILLCSLESYSQAVSVTVGTFNLWNVMFNWRTRIRHIADIIRENYIDIVAFQEVRLTKVGNERLYSSQLDEFKAILPEYKWSVTRSAGPAASNKRAYNKEWNLEGLGLLSRKEILSVSVVNMVKIQSPDTNHRIALHVKVKTGPGSTDVIDIIVVHFSYDRQEQCWNAVDVLRIVKNSQLQNAVVLGDFNVYSGFESAVRLFTVNQDPACFISSYNISHRGFFKDAWLSAGRQSSEGLTFSNMPVPGLQSRPDRILVSRNITVEFTKQAGNGTDYREHYYKSILISRAKSIIRTAFDTYWGSSGYPCSQDCGPSGSCRCGICVSGGNQKNCNIPDCQECTSFMFILFLAMAFLIVIDTSIVFISVLRILVISAKIKQQDVLEVLGYRCCLFNPHLFRFVAMPRRFKSKIEKLSFLWAFPPVIVLSLMLVLLTFLLLLSGFLFRDSIQLVYSLLPEESFPSDHLIVFTRLSW